MAREYGWSKMDILENVYPKEAIEYTKLIKRDMIENYKMLLAINQNLYAKDPKQLWDTLEREGQKGGIIKSSGLDKVALGRLKQKLKRSKTIKVKS